MSRVSFVDLDETLFYTFAKIRVIKDGIILKQLSNQEFNTYDLQDGEQYDFTEFKDVDIFKTSSPMLSNIEKIIKSNTDEIVILTARSNMNDKDEFLKFLQSNGIDAGHYEDGKIHVVRCGEIGSNPPQNKVTMINKIIQKRQDISTISLYDDSLANLDAVQNGVTEVEVELYQVHHDSIYRLRRV